MYKLIVVEDETIIRRGIVKSIHWGKMGYEVVGEASDGKEAIKLVQDKEVDVIITDIRMEGMGGIELAKYIYEQYPQIKVVILSGYEDVEYLKEAIKSNVVDYLLKPTGSQQITQVFNKIKIQLDEQYRKQNEFNIIKKQLNENIEYTKEKIIKKLINGHYENEQQILNELSLNNISLKNINYVMIVDIDKYYSMKQLYSNNEIHKILDKIASICNKMFIHKKLGEFIINGEEIVGLCTNYISKKGNVNELLKQIQKKIFNQLHVTASISVGNQYDELIKLKLSYDEAKKALKQKVFFGRESIIRYNKLLKHKKIKLSKSYFEADKIINIIFYDNKKDFIKYIDKVFVQFNNRVVYNPDMINYMCLELLFIIARQARQMNLSVEKFINETELNYEDIYKIDSIVDKKQWLIKVLDNIKQFVENSQSSNSKDLINKVIDYVNKNFMRNDISLNLISTVMHKNSAYISKLFKEKTGQNFTEYITKLRMKKAMLFLQEDKYKIYEISSKVGYADVSHFTRTFKKYNGISPIEYRETSGSEVS